MRWMIGRWYVVVEWNYRHNYVSLADGWLRMKVAHFKVSFRLHWKPWIPRIRMWEFFYHPLGADRWTSHELSFEVWPISLWLHWFPTCHRCVGKYSRDYEEYQSRRAEGVTS